MIIDNNKFNNFYKHRDEFIKFFKDKIIINELISVLDNSSTEIISVFYGKYFGNNYREFSPRINREIKDNVDKFIIALKDSILNRGSIDFFSLEVKELRELVELFDYHWPDAIGIVRKKSEKEQSFRENHNSLLSKNIGGQFLPLFCIYFTTIIISIVYAFEGTEIKGLVDFYRNYDLYLNKCGLLDSIIKK